MKVKRISSLLTKHLKLDEFSIKSLSRRWRQKIAIKNKPIKTKWSINQSINQSIGDIRHSTRNKCRQVGGEMRKPKGAKRKKNEGRKEKPTWWEAWERRSSRWGFLSRRWRRSRLRSDPPAVAASAVDERVDRFRWYELPRLLSRFSCRLVCRLPLKSNQIYLITRKKWVMITKS